MKSLWILFIGMCGLIVSCNQTPTTPEATRAVIVTDSIHLMLDHLTKDLERTGCIAWLNYFDKGDDFFMASDGKLAFKNYPAAKLFIEDTLVYNIRKINLTFAHLRIDSLNSHLAVVGALFHEDISSTSAINTEVDGYFTALITQTGQGWKIRNLHWSINKTK